MLNHTYIYNVTPVWCSFFTISNIMLFRKSHGLNHWVYAIGIFFLIKFVFAIATDIRPCGIVSSHSFIHSQACQIVAARFPKWMCICIVPIPNTFTIGILVYI